MFRFIPLLLCFSLILGLSIGDQPPDSNQNILLRLREHPQTDPFVVLFSSSGTKQEEKLSPPPKDPFGLFSSSSGSDKQQNPYPQNQDRVNSKIIVPQPQPDGQIDPLDLFSISSGTKDNGSQQNSVGNSKSNVAIADPQSQNQNDPHSLIDLDTFDSNIFKSNGAPALPENEKILSKNPSDDNPIFQRETQGQDLKAHQLGDDNLKSNELHPVPADPNNALPALLDEKVKSIATPVDIQENLKPNIKSDYRNTGEQLEPKHDSNPVIESDTNRHEASRLLDSIFTQQPDEQTRNQQQQQSDVIPSLDIFTPIKKQVDIPQSNPRGTISETHVSDVHPVSNQDESIPQTNGQMSRGDTVIQPDGDRMRQPQLFSNGQQGNHQPDSQILDLQSKLLGSNFEQDIFKQNNEQNLQKHFQPNALNWNTTHMDKNSLFNAKEEHMPVRTDAKSDVLKDENSQFNNEDVNHEAEQGMPENSFRKIAQSNNEDKNKNINSQMKELKNNAESIWGKLNSEQPKLSEKGNQEISKEEYTSQSGMKQNMENRESPIKSNSWNDGEQQLSNTKQDKEVQNQRNIIETKVIVENKSLNEAYIIPDSIFEQQTEDRNINRGRQQQQQPSDVIPNGDIFAPLNKEVDAPQSKDQNETPVWNQRAPTPQYNQEKHGEDTAIRPVKDNMEDGDTPDYSDDYNDDDDDDDDYHDDDIDNNDDDDDANNDGHDDEYDSADDYNNGFNHNYKDAGNTNNDDDNLDLGPGVDEDDVNNDFDEDGDDDDDDDDYLVTKAPYEDYTTTGYFDYSSDPEDEDDSGNAPGEVTEEDDWYHDPDRASDTDDEENDFGDYENVDENDLFHDDDEDDDVNAHDTADGVADDDELWARFESRDEDTENDDNDNDMFKDGHNDQYYHGKFPEEDNLNHMDDEVKDTKPPTAPTSMVLFYTWMILVILVMVTVVSTYQAKCKGLVSNGNRQQTRAGEDRKRLRDHEFV